MGKLTISMAIFNSKLYVYQRVSTAIGESMTTSLDPWPDDIKAEDIRPEAGGGSSAWRGEPKTIGFQRQWPLLEDF